MRIDVDIDEIDLEPIGAGALRPRVVLASYYVLTAPFSPRFGVPGIFAMLLTGGQVDYATSTGAHGTAGPGDLLLFPVGQSWYRVHPHTPVTAYMLTALPTGEWGRRVRLALPEIGPLPARLPVGDRLTALARLCERCMQGLLELQPGWELETAAAWLAFLHLACYPQSPRQAPGIDVWTALLQRLHAAPQDRLVSELAAEMGLGVEHFIRRFRAFTGVTPKQYMLHSRLTRARALLRQGQAVKAAALATGFDDPLYFSRRYRQEFGYPPSATPDDDATDPHDPAVGLPVSHHLMAPDVDMRWFGADAYH